MLFAFYVISSSLFTIFEATLLHPIKESSQTQSLPPTNQHMLHLNQKQHPPSFVMVKAVELLPSVHFHDGILLNS